VAGVERFADEAKLAMLAGVAPLDASSGRQQRHRLNHKGNRQLNLALHRIAVTQARMHPPARAYLERKRGREPARGAALPQAPSCPPHLAHPADRLVGENDLYLSQFATD
jgi:transposase